MNRQMGNSSALTTPTVPALTIPTIPSLTTPTVTSIYNFLNTEYNFVGNRLSQGRKLTNNIY